MQSQFNDIQEELQSVKGTVNNTILPQLKAIQEEVCRVAITQENTVIPKINLIYDNQVEIIQEHRRMQQLETNTSILNDVVSVLQHVAKDHAKRITVLEQAR